MGPPCRFGDLEAGNPSQERFEEHGYFKFCEVHAGAQVCAHAEPEMVARTTRDVETLGRRIFGRVAIGAGVEHERTITGFEASIADDNVTGD